MALQLYLHLISQEGYSLRVVKNVKGLEKLEVFNRIVLPGYLHVRSVLKSVEGLLGSWQHTSKEHLQS